MNTKKFRKAGIITAISLFCVAAILCIISVFAGSYMADYGLKPISSREYNEDSWLVKNTEIVSATSFDQLELKAYYTENTIKSHYFGIFMHGYHSSPFSMEPYGKHFFENGWNVLLPGQRGHGWSQGNCVDMGLIAKQDVLTWIDFILSKDKDAKIVLYGVSMGAATVMMATGLNLPENVICAIEDCGYYSVWEQFKYQLKEQFNLPAFPVLYFARLFSKSRYGIDINGFSPAKAVSSSRTPTLFIHGTSDTYVPYYMHEKLFNAAICEKEYLIIKDAEHAKAEETNPELYWKTVDNFVSKYR